MRTLHHLFVVGCLLLSSSPTVHAQDDTTQSVSDNTQRIRELEDQVFELDSRIGSRAAFQAFSAVEADLGGQLTVLGTRAEGDNSSSTAVNATFLELYIKARISEEFSVFGTPGFFFLSDTSFADGANPTTNIAANQSDVTFQRAYGEWHPSDAVHLQFGRFGTDHGVITSEYFIPTRIILDAPMLARALGENTLYPQKLDGIKFQGTRPVGTDTVEYTAYIGVDTRDTESFDTGVRLGYVFEELGLSLAANAGHGDRVGFTSFTGLPTNFNLPGFFSPFPVLSNSDAAYDFQGLDVDYRKDSWVVKGEYYTTQEERGQPDRLGWYIQPAYYFTPRWSLALRQDHFQAGQGLGKADESVVSLNFNPNGNVRFRLDYANTDLPSAATADSISTLILSASFSF